MQQRHHLLTLSEGGGGCRQTPPAILWFGGSCLSIVVLTSSLKICMQLFLCKLHQFSDILSHLFLLFQECSFNKLHDNTALRVSYQGNVRVYTIWGCNRWHFKFNGNECSGPLPIDSAVYTDWAGGRSNIHRNHFFEGYCENLARGTVNVELWIGNCPGELTGDAYTGWNTVSRIMIEEVPPSQ